MGVQALPAASRSHADKELRGQGHIALAYRADVSNEDDVGKIFRAVRDQYGTVDTLINHADLQQDAPVDQMTPAQFDKIIGFNLTGHFLCAREALDG